MRKKITDDYSLHKRYFLCYVLVNGVALVVEFTIALTYSIFEKQSSDYSEIIVNTQLWIVVTTNIILALCFGIVGLRRLNIRYFSGDFQHTNELFVVCFIFSIFVFYSIFINLNVFFGSKRCSFIQLLCFYVFY